MTCSRGSEPRMSVLAVPWGMRRVGKGAAVGGSFVLGPRWAKCTPGAAGHFSSPAKADSPARVLHIL